MTKLLLGATLAFTVLVAACGGNVVVDPGGNGGAGNTTTVGQGGGVGGASCFNPPDPATLTFCGVGGSGPNGQCENDFCDDNGNVWAAVCTSSACQCRLNGLVVCTCAANEPGDFCNGTPTCCPLPKL